MGASVSVPDRGVTVDEAKALVPEGRWQLSFDARFAAAAPKPLPKAVALEAWAKAGDKAERANILARGLRADIAENRQLWARLQGDLAGAGNQLPAALKANLISLSLWVDRACGEVLGGGDGLQALIDVNQNILGGLSGRRPAPTALETDGTQSHAQAV